MQVALRDAEALVERRRPASGVGDPQVSDAHLVDLHDEDLPGARAAHLHRPDERVPAVELGIARLEALARPSRVLRRADSPTGVGCGERDRVPGLDRQHRLEVAREVAVEGPPLERDLVERHQARRSARSS